jgi:type IV secretion system protein VirD4
VQFFRIKVVPVTKVLWGQIMIVIAVVVMATWGATQWTAWRLGYQIELGQPWMQIASLKVYPPPAFFWWWFSFDAYAPRIFFEGGLIAASGGLAAVAIAICE